MNKQDTVKVIAYIVSAYPAHDKFKDDSQIEAMVNIWADMFRDDDVALVGMAVRKHISVSKWPPSIAEIREQMALMKHPELIAPDIAWASVSDILNSDAVRDIDYADSSGLRRYFPELIAKVIDSVGWSALRDMHCGHYGNYHAGQDRRAFMDLYVPAYERAKENAMLPGAILDKMNAIKLQSPETKMLEEAHTARIKSEQRWRCFYENQIGMLPESENERKCIDEN